MTIDGLNALTTLTAGDELPVWDVEASAEEPTKKITAQNMAASVKSLGSLIGTGDLDSTPTQGSNKAVTSGGIYTAIQQRTAGGAGYFKSQDGTLIQWGKHTFNPSSTSGTQRGNLYFYECKNRISFPIAFTAAPAVTINKAGGQMASVGWTSITYSGIEEVDFVNGMSSISASDVFTVDWVAFGRWK